MSDWPKHPDGRPMKLGEMPTWQRREQLARAVLKVKAELERPEVGTAIAKVLETAERKAGVQPDPRVAAMVSEAAELLEKFGDYELGDL